MSDLKQYKCPNCGGSCEWDSKSQKVKCPYCDTEFDIDTISKADEETDKISDGQEMTWDTQAGSSFEEGETDGFKVYVCENCGGEIIADDNTLASICPYCDSPVMIKESYRGSLKPDYVIPFKLDKKAAKDAYFRHIQGKKLLPKVFRDENHIDEIKGLYVPFWLFDAKANGQVVFEGTRLKMWSTREYDYTQTSFYRIFRSGSMEFENVPVDGSSKMPDELMQSIEPFDMDEALDFNTAYMAGFLADKYDVTADDNISIANERIKTSTAGALQDTVIGYNSVTEKKRGISLSEGTAKYAMFPVWILNTTYRGEKYTFAMNGQTGKMVGNLPLDKNAYYKNFALYAGIISCLCFGLQYLLWFM